MSQGGPLAGMAPELQAQLFALAAGPTPNEVPLKQPVRAASTSALTFSGEQTIDGVACVAGDRVLAKNQSSDIDNGIYVIQAIGNWSRADDADEDREWEPGTLVPVLSGTLNAGTLWQCTTSAPILIGTSSLTFSQQASSGVPFAATMSTSDATATTIATVAIPTTSAVLIEYKVIGMKTDASAMAIYKNLTGYRNAAGTVTIVTGGPTVVAVLEDDAAYAVTEDISTTNVLIKVTGKAATNMHWRIEGMTTVVA